MKRAILLASLLLAGCQSRGTVAGTVIAYRAGFFGGHTVLVGTHEWRFKSEGAARKTLADAGRNGYEVGIEYECPGWLFTTCKALKVKRRGAP